MNRFRYGLLLVAVAGLNACATTNLMDLPPSQRLYAEVRAVLGNDWPSPEYQRVRMRLQEMGPEVDSILVAIIQDRRARTAARADALVLLADRGSPLALPTLRSALHNENEALRSASVLGLNQLAGSSEQAMELIRLAAEDRSRRVRLNALQSLEIRDVATIRRVLQFESDPEVRKVALQLVALAEARGATLVPDSRGALRTASDETQPQIVFRPVTLDPDADVAFGDLRVELPQGRDLPLASSAEVIANVLPAFFSPDWSAVVSEVGDEIRVFDIEARSSRSLGEGIAPRLVPFTQNFVFFREVPDSRVRTADGSRLLYDVYLGSFAAAETERIGRMTALVRPEVHGGESPVRWMVVSDAGDGFVLRGDGVDTFPLPAPVWGAAAAHTQPPGLPFRD
ncbi:MAG TPA: HEAT repeat domain-containing protein [Longimicrobiaceae bacterium]|nr:HEAT repeat domain-containing protein [Longimicrobiaceae bacterium]